MVTPTRLANKTIWSLEDILKLVQEAEQVWEALRKRIDDESQDPVMYLHMARLRDRLTNIKAVAFAARHGEHIGDLLSINMEEHDE